MWVKRMNKTQQITIAGFGGQGVMMIGQLLAYAGNEVGYESLWFPSYGPETRGGTANCAVTISQHTIHSPVFSQASCLMILNKPSLLKFQDKIQDSGILLYNASLIREDVTSKRAHVYPIPMHEIAQSLGNPKVANMVMLGAYLGLTSFFSLSTMEAVLKKFLTEEKQALVSINIQAIQAGIAYVTDKK